MMGGLGAFALALIKWAPLAFQGIEKARELIDWGVELIDRLEDEQRDPTDEEWALLNSKIAELQGQLHSDDA